MRTRVLMLAGGFPGGIMEVRAQGLAANATDDVEATVATHVPGASKLRDLWDMWRTVIKVRPDCIYVLNTGAVGIPAVMAKLVFGTPFIVDTGDLSFRFVSVLGYGRWLWRLWIGLSESVLLRYAAAVVVRGTHHHSLLEGKLGPKVFHLPDGVDTRTRRPLDVAAERRNRGWSDKLTVGLLGNLTWSARHDWGTGRELVELISLLREEPVHGVIIGDGPGRVVLETMAKELGVSARVSFTGFIPYQDLPAELNLIDVCLLTLIDDESWEVRTTGKLPEYLACGRYVIATQIGEAKRILPEHQILQYHGIWDPRYPALLATCLRRIRGNLDAELKRARLEGPRVAAALFDYRILGAQWSGIIKAVTSKQDSSRP